jgi:hypothetical protein
MYQTIGRLIRGMMHRPRFADGEPVETEDLTFSHTFYYRPTDVESSPEAEQIDDAASSDR